METTLQQAIEFFKTEIEKQVEILLEDEREYSQELGEEIISELGEDTEHCILMQEFEKRYDFNLRDEIKFCLNAIPYFGDFVLNAFDDGRDIVVWLDKDDEDGNVDDYSEEIAIVEPYYKKYNTGDAEIYTDTYADADIRFLLD